MTLPLDGIIVVSLEQAVAAPFATRQLADLGARVIKIERPGQGDFARGYDETVRGMSSHFVWLNRGKESIQLDLKSPEDALVAQDLVGMADIFVQNVAPGAAARLGLGAADLRRARPELIHCSVSGYGDGGPYTDKKAYDLLVQCEAGLVSITGTPDTPSKVGISVADIAAGMYAYSGLLSALIQRGRSGEGATLEISMLEALAEWMGYPYYFTEYGGQSPERTGSAHASIAPYGPVPCAGGRQVFLGIQNEREWDAFCRSVIRQPQLATDPRFSGNSARVAHRTELDAAIAGTLLGLDAAEVLERLDAAGIANAELRDMHGLSEHPQLAARDRWRAVATPVGDVSALLPPATVLGTEPRMGAVPGPGEHTQQILAELRTRTGRSTADEREAQS